ncbi:MAG: hypothetical protein ACRD1B_10395 [Thermoanaerobaculia bacterium]
MICVRKGFDGAEEVLLDPATLSPDRTANAQLSGISRDGSLSGDTRGPPQQAVKMAAKLQWATRSGLPVLLRFDRKSGHAGGLPAVEGDRGPGGRAGVPARAAARPGAGTIRPEPLID